jgi:hypothetical protein
MSNTEYEQVRALRRRCRLQAGMYLIYAVVVGLTAMSLVDAPPLMGMCIAIAILNGDVSGYWLALATRPA